MIATYFYFDIFGIEFSIWKYYSVEALKFIDTEIRARATKSKFRRKAFPLNHGINFAATRTFKQLHTTVKAPSLAFVNTRYQLSRRQPRARASKFGHTSIRNGYNY